LKQQKQNENQLLTLSGLADYLGVSYNSAIRLKRESDLPRIKMGRNSYYRVSAIKAWLAQKERESK